MLAAAVEAEGSVGVIAILQLIPQTFTTDYLWENKYCLFMFAL